MAKQHPKSEYEHPLTSRYASVEMSRLFSPYVRHHTWRRIWIALAEAQHELGLEVSQKQIRALKRAHDTIDFKSAAKYEKQLRHDVMAHIHTFGDAAPEARAIIHLGATSMDIVDNADLLITREALQLLIGRCVTALAPLADFCEEHAAQPALGFTHLQPAQLTTVGKRASLWAIDLLADLHRLVELHAGLKARGLRGATGTQASFLKLLGSPAKVRQLEKKFASKLGFDDCYAVCGQTYSRRTDSELIHSLVTFAGGVQRICNDIRVGAMLKEIEEPFGKKQVGSSAMPYKRNPMRSERATGLARYLVSLGTSPPMTHAAQIFERTLDDSANKRLVFPEAFLTADALLILLANIFDGLVVYPATIHTRIMSELPFIASEDIMMAAVQAGGDRQDLHERIRAHAQKAGNRVKQEGQPNDLIERLQGDAAFAKVKWDKVLEPSRYVGLAPQQTRDFVKKQVRPALKKYGSLAADAVGLHV